MGSPSKFWTKELIGTSLVVDEGFGFTKLSIICTSGTITVIGTLPAGGIAPDAFTLSLGQGVNIGNGDGSTLMIDEITIDATGGAAALIGN